jgi:glycerol-3-phosphate dehydrogenase
VTGQIKRISGVRIVQHGQPGLYFSHRIINATGAWSNHVLELDSDTPLVKVAPTKGVHIVIDVPISDHAVILTAPQDGRVFFVMPYHTQTLVGTTDTLYTGSPDQVKVTDEDIEYLLTAVRHYFPQLSISRTSIVSTYSGLRPLIAPKTTTSASQISRDFVISYSQNGLWTLLGGKYTTHRLMASKLLSVIESKMRR